MKKTVITLISFLGATLPALAGPDWQLIEQGRTAKQARAQLAQAPQQSDKHEQMLQMMKDCMEMKKKS